MKKGITIFFVVYLFIYALTSCSALRADEPTKAETKKELNCEAFINEDICNMSDEEMEIFFLEFLNQILEQTLAQKKQGLDI